MPNRRYPSGPPMFTAMRALRNMGGGNDLSAVPVFLADVARRYGPIAHWKILRGDYYLLDDPALIEEVLVTNARDYMKGRGIQRLKRLLGNGLLTSEQPVHLRQRRMMQPAFHKDRVAAYGARMVDTTLAHSAPWRDGDVVEIDREMMRLTLAITADTLFSADVAAHSDRISAALTEAMQTFPTSMSLLGEYLDRFPLLPVTRRFYRALATLDAVIYGIINERRRDPDSGGHDDLLAMLLDVREDSRPMDDREVRDEAMTIFLAGHETTANALTWCWYLLARHPDVASRLRAELDAVLPAGRPPTAADLPELTYTHDVFAEAMRLYPPAWILGRRALRETTIGAYTIPAGSIVLASQLITQRNPAYWTQPDAFQPERWSDESRKPPKFAYFPFGGGNRRCIGEPFAWMEGVLILAAIAQQYDLEAVDDEAVAIQPLVTLRPRTSVRVRVRVRERVSASSL